MGNTGSVDGGEGFKHVYATIKMPQGCLCSNGIPSRGYFKFENRAKLLPEKTTAMLNEKSAMPVYDAFVQALSETPKLMLGAWKESRLFEITTEFEPKFEACGVKVYLCKFTSKDGVFWWFMFEDTALAGPNPVRGKKGVNGALWKEYGSNKDIGGSW